MVHLDRSGFRFGVEFGGVLGGVLRSGVPAKRAAVGLSFIGITVNYLTWMVLGGVFVVMLVQAIVVLEQYGWTSKETNHE